ncbi:MAG TPA: Holliday junction ATP-dependent DNA helicase RuvA [Bacillota bacterium]|nr:Holliday junction ATP-dependent DNA helicase RuvA [Bacillota bacterium]
MISAITGNLSQVLEDRVVLEVNGLSYEVLVSPVTLGALLPKRDQEVSLKTIFYIQGTPGVGNMIPVLVGFMTETEKAFFEYFITVGGIGPRAALKAFTMPVGRIARAIEDGDSTVLTTLPGIGKQKAKKIIAELKGKVDKFAVTPDEDRDVEQAVGVTEEDNIIEEAIEVLMQLGYKRQESEEMVRRAIRKHEEITSLEAVIQEIFRSSVKPGATPK